MGSTVRSAAGIATLGAATTIVGVGVAYWIEVVAFGIPALDRFLLVGLVEEAFARFVPLIATFYFWSYWRSRLLSKTEGLVATIASGLTVSGLELVVKLVYLSRLETVARFDALVLPIVFVHLPFALIAGRFAYAIGERIHGHKGFPEASLSRRTLLSLLVGYVVLVVAHVGYNVLVRSA